MNPSYRAWFLIIVACVALKMSGWQTAVVLIGYGIAEYADQHQARKVRGKIFEEVIVGWKQSKDNSVFEEKGNMSRVRLVGQNQIIAARIADLVSRMP